MKLSEIVKLSYEDLKELKEELESQLFYVNNEIELRELLSNMENVKWCNKGLAPAPSGLIIKK